MKIFTKDVLGLRNAEPLDALVARLSSQLLLVKGAYSIPPECGRQTALAKLLAYLLFRNTSACIYITCWSVFTEHLDLFYGYRRSVGETRPLIEAPVHLFEAAEEDAFISVLCVVLYFAWDAWVFDLDGKSLVRMSHDEWFEIRRGDQDSIEKVAAALENYSIPLLIR